MIKERSYKMRAEITLTKERKINKEDFPWVLPFDNNILIRITPGHNRREILEDRKQYILRLYNIPKNINEILLFRQIKYTNAKSIHVFRNANGNNKGYAIVSFKNKKDLFEARRYSIKYYDTRLTWEGDNPNRQDNMYRTVPSEDYKNYEDDTSNERSFTKENNYRNVYSKNKRREIREGKKRETPMKLSNSTSTISK